MAYFNSRVKIDKRYWGRGGGVDFQKGSLFCHSFYFWTYLLDICMRTFGVKGYLYVYVIEYVCVHVIVCILHI